MLPPQGRRRHRPRLSPTPSCLSMDSDRPFTISVNRAALAETRARPGPLSRVIDQSQLRAAPVLGARALELMDGRIVLVLGLASLGTRHGDPHCRSQSCELGDQLLAHLEPDRAIAITSDHLGGLAVSAV